eukprot:1733918-Prymnesium_polylepis.2
MHDNKLPYDLRGQSWTVQSFTTHFLQRFSSAVNMAVAQEIRSQICFSGRLPSTCPRLHPGAGAASGFGPLRARAGR